MSRTCPSPPKEKGGKGPKGGGKGGKGGKAGYYGKTGQPPRWCPTCNKSGHLPDTCWVTHPHLKKVKKVQSLEEGQEVECNYIDLGALEVACTTCATDYDTDHDNMVMCCPPGLKCALDERSMGGANTDALRRVGTPARANQPINTDALRRVGTPAGQIQ